MQNSMAIIWVFFVLDLFLQVTIHLAFWCQLINLQSVFSQRLKVSGFSLYEIRRSYYKMRVITKCNVYYKICWNTVKQHYTFVLISIDETFWMEMEKGQTEQRWEYLLIGELPEECRVKTIKNVTRGTPYSMQDNQTFFQHIAMTVYFFILN